MADGWDEGFRYGVETFDVGVSAMATYMSAPAPPVFDGGISAVSAGLAGFPQDVLDAGRALRDGRYVEDPPWLLVATPTLVDPSRAPEGRHTVKFLCAQSYGFPERKEAQAEGLDPNVWFHNVELGAAKIVGQETVRYVANIYKYYVAYKLATERQAERAAERDRAKATLDDVPQ